MNNPAPKRVVLLVSTMRSGSTLLKALLGAAKDVSHLGETDFQTFQKEDALDQISAMAAEPIILLKRPAWFNEIATYPRFPNIDGPYPSPSLRCILLVRDVVPTVHSLQKMALRKTAPLLGSLCAPWLARRYWAGITESIATLHHQHPADTCLVRYEDLTRHPIEETKRLFDFMGLPEQPGVDTYDTPKHSQWQWGNDDGSPTIRTLKVQAARHPKAPTKRLRKVINTDLRIRRLRHELGYLEPDA